MFSYEVLLLFNVFHKGTPESPIPFQRNENVWVYLAKHIMNVSEFSLKGGTYVEQTFTSRLVGVCTCLNQIKKTTPSFGLLISLCLILTSTTGDPSPRKRT